MFWNDKSDKKPGFAVPDDVVDLAFRLNCPTLPLDHAHALSSGLLQELPWLAEEQHAGVHLVHCAASGNGWYRPEDTTNELLHLSKRTRMRLRVPRHRLDDARELTGKKLDIAGHPLEVGTSEVFLLSSQSTLFARYVITSEDVDEEQFLEAAAKELRAIDIPCRKMLCGISHTMVFPDGSIFTRSLMVADLEPEQSVRLQQIGLGEGRTIGCGLFIPHKGIKAVKETDEK
jgi:CRISPR-associated protein Cas6